MGVSFLVGLDLSWLRSGNNNNASNANYLDAAGSYYNSVVDSAAYAVRPALHSPPV